MITVQLKFLNRTTAQALRFDCYNLQKQLLNSTISHPIITLFAINENRSRDFDFDTIVRPSACRIAKSCRTKRLWF